MNKILFPSPLFFIYHNFHFLPKEIQKIKEKGVAVPRHYSHSLIVPTSAVLLISAVQLHSKY